MNQETLSQLVRECQETIGQLREFRDEFNQDERSIQAAAGHSLSKERLVDLEHLHNQFDIQLKNIHDLKHNFETLQKQLPLVTDDKFLNEKQQGLREEFKALKGTLLTLRSEFDKFQTKI